MFAAVSILHVSTVCRVRAFSDVAANWFDNGQYLQLVAIILKWRPTQAAMPHHFWGFPFAIAAISKLFSIAGIDALVLISVLGSLGVCLLVHRLYGGWVALAVFSFINYRWIYSSLEGGSEPLFMCLLYASFLAARSDRWNLATLLAALSTTVRPLGIFALAGFAVVLALRRDYRRLALITLIGLTIGVLYVVPLWLIVGSPFANFTGYRGDWGPQGWPLTYPLGGMIPSLLALHALRWPNVVLSLIWLALALTGIVAMWLPRQRPRFSVVQPEALFASLYTLFFVLYNYAGVFEDLPRFLMPVLPLYLFSLRDWIPKDRRVLWGAAGLSALLASAAMVGFKNVFGFRLP